MSGTTSLFRSKKVSLMLAMISCIVLALVWLEPTKARALQSDLVVTVADAGIQSFATSGLATTPTLQVETFDTRSTCNPCSFNFSGNAGSFSGTGAIFNAGVYGGAGGSGRHPTAGDLYLTMPSTSDYKYLGFWWSAGNTANQVDILDINNNVLATFVVDLANSTEDLQGVVGTCSGANPPTNGYCGNPNLSINNGTNTTNYSNRPIPSEQYAFVHLRYEPGFRKVRFRGNAQGGFEFDNVTVSQTAPPLASTETSVETFVQYTVTTPSVLIADPRASTLSFPGVTLGAGTGETNAMLCFSQVTQAGGAITGSSEVVAAGTGTGVTGSSGTNLVTFSGARDTVVSFSPNVDFQSVPSGERYGVGSIYIRVVATPQTNAGSSGCTGDAAVSVVIEVRFLTPLLSDSVGISID